MFNTLKSVTTPNWEEGIFECNAKIVYGMRYSDVYHTSCFEIKVYKQSRKKGQLVDWSVKLCDPYDTLQWHRSELFELLQFDGWLQKGLPADYRANALYFYHRFRGWFKIGGGTLKSKPTEYWNYFRSFCLMGDDEKLPEILSERELPLLVDWLRKRESKLQSKFEEAMRRHGIEYL